MNQVVSELSSDPRDEPSSEPSSDPTDEPISEPSSDPTNEPSSDPSSEPNSSSYSSPSAPDERTFQIHSSVYFNSSVRDWCLQATNPKLGAVALNVKPCDNNNNNNNAKINSYTIKQLNPGIKV